jgi:hypothetical protein
MIITASANLYKETYKEFAARQPLAITVQGVRMPCFVMHARHQYLITMDFGSLARPAAADDQAAKW